VIYCFSSIIIQTKRIISPYVSLIETFDQSGPGFK